MLKCAYCREEKKVTRDHVISRALFPKKYDKTNPIIVPSCRECNNGFSKDEEYFRQFLNFFSMEHSKESKDIFNTKIRRSIERRPQIGHKAMSKMEIVDLFTESGIYLGKKTKIDISDEDWIRHHTVLDKYIKGLFYHEFNRPLPVDYKIKHVLCDQDEFLLKVTSQVNKWNKENKEIFAYAYNSITDSYNSIWVTVYYDSMVFISFVIAEKEYDKMEAMSKKNPTTPCPDDSMLCMESECKQWMMIKRLYS